MESGKGTDMLTVEDVAKAASVSTGYIRRLLSQGVIKGVKVGDNRRGMWLIPPHIARAWLEQRAKA